MNITAGVALAAIGAALITSYGNFPVPWNLRAKSPSKALPLFLVGIGLLSTGVTLAARGNLIILTCVAASVVGCLHLLAKRKRDDEPRL